MDLDLDLLRTFVTVSETRSFSAAGKILGRSQPAVSLQIKRLENRIGARLLERSARSATLTATGNLLLDYARQITALHDEAAARVSSPDVRTFVRLGVLEELATKRLPDILQSFATLYPNAKLEVQVRLGNELISEMIQGRLDLVVAHGEREQPGATPLWREPLAWVASKRTPTIASGAVPLVLLPDPCFYRHRAIKALAQANQQWDSVCTSSTMTGIRAAVIAGIGITAMGQSEVTSDFKRLGSEDGLPSLGSVQMMLYHAADNFAPMVRSLAVHLRRFVFPA